jgi:putative transposase
MTDQTSHTKDWPHAPLHRLGSDGVFMVTGATLYMEHFFKGRDRLDILEGTLLTLSMRYEWQLEAWAAFANHYHIVARGNGTSQDLGIFLNHLHSETARKLNELDYKSGRQVWYNFWETKLTFEKSYLARLNYVHQNPVKHGLVLVANQYPWCSAGWFERTASSASVKTIYSFKTDRLKIDDYY